ncbi:TAXI family TRAP transporter solute-binding subunit [Tissierella sp. Yu-01]|uniref:TAXI family TRAP transporter solute-binding subunit n=1 Tax=Tissierella sp. Yu-01 TaxID=3035694 RepID=UPI00240D8255|nr:TAXI family TRAP transporter solute-binding subunit [Tissierella sp. Yu-01]WFA10085.1 TAXI family TRAP transporter solute-binding subunit [Tissierella sp. Yu-01]
MKTKTISVLLIFTMIASVLTGCAVQTASAVDVDKTIINIATGGTGGTYYPLGSAMARIYNDHIKNVTTNVLVTDASIENIKLIANGKSEIAFVQNDVAYYAWTGAESFTDKVENIRGMAMLYPEVIQIVASKDSRIMGIEDLKGKKVAVGALNSGTEIHTRQILAEYGMTYEDLQKADYLSFNDAADHLKDKEIDAAFITAGIPTSAISEIIETEDFVLVPLTSACIASLNEKYPFYTEVNIPANSYNNQSNNIRSAAVMAMLVVPKDLDEYLVYNLTKHLFEQRQVLINSHEKGREIRLAIALKDMPITLHPGAQRYYNEKGVL